MIYLSPVGTERTRDSAESGLVLKEPVLVGVFDSRADKKDSAQLPGCGACGHRAGFRSRRQARAVFKRRHCRVLGHRRAG